MTLHAADHFDRKIYEIRYAGNPQRIRSYLLTAYRIRQADPAGSAPGTWLSELCDYQEFQVLSGVCQPGEPRIGGPDHLQMGAGAKGEAASKAGSPGERSERIMRIHLFSFTVINGNGRATSRESVHRMPNVFVGWGVPRSHEKGDPTLNPLGPVATHVG